MNTLTTRWADGKVRHLDFLIDGRSLLGLMERPDCDVVSCLGWGRPEYNDNQVLRLVGKAMPDAIPGRVLFYVCPMCGDLGCGAITGVVQAVGDQLTWSDFAFQNDLSPTEDPDVGYYEEISHVGPFTFSLSQCEQVLRAGLVSP